MFKSQKKKPQNQNPTKTKPNMPVMLEATVGKLQHLSPGSSFIAHPNTHLLFLALWTDAHTISSLERMAVGLKREANR